MTNQKAKTLGLVAGILMILVTLISLGSLVLTYHQISANVSTSFFQIYWLTLLMDALAVLLGVALIMDNLLMARIVQGAIVLRIFVTVAASIITLVNVGADRYSPLYPVSNVIALIGAALLLTAFFLPGRRGQLLAFLALGTSVITAVLPYVANELIRTEPAAAIVSIVMSLVFMIPSVLVALYIGAKGMSPAPAYGGASQPSADNRSPLEKLAWLQDMMARGYMGQLEYEQKKNEILDVNMPVSDKLAWYENLMQKGYLNQQEYNDRRDALLNYAGK